MEGQWGEILSNILLKLEGDALYKAIDQLSARFRRSPNFLKVVSKSIQSEYTRGISIDRCLSIILQTSKMNLIIAYKRLKML